MRVRGTACRGGPLFTSTQGRGDYQVLQPRGAVLVRRRAGRAWSASGQERRKVAGQQPWEA